MQCKYNIVDDDLQIEEELVEDIDTEPVRSDDVLTDSNRDNSWWWKITARTPAESFPPWLHDVDTTEVSRWSDEDVDLSKQESMNDLITYKPTILGVNTKPTYQHPRNSHLKNNLQSYPLDRRDNGKNLYHQNSYNNNQFGSIQKSTKTPQEVTNKNAFHYSSRPTLNIQKERNNNNNNDQLKMIENMVNSQAHLSEKDKLLLINSLTRSTFSEHNTNRQELPSKYSRNNIRNEPRARSTDSISKQTVEPTFSSVKVPLANAPRPLLNSLWKSSTPAKRKTVKPKQLNQLNSVTPHVSLPNSHTDSNLNQTLNTSMVTTAGISNTAERIQKGAFGILTLSSQ